MRLSQRRALVYSSEVQSGQPSQNERHDLQVSRETKDAETNNAASSISYREGASGEEGEEMRPDEMPGKVGEDEERKEPSRSGEWRVVTATEAAQVCQSHISSRIRARRLRPQIILAEENTQHPRTSGWGGASAASRLTYPSLHCNHLCVSTFNSFSSSFHLSFSSTARQARQILDLNLIFHAG